MSGVGESGVGEDLSVEEELSLLMEVFDVEGKSPSELSGAEANVFTGVWLDAVGMLVLFSVSAGVEGKVLSAASSMHEMVESFTSAWQLSGAEGADVVELSGAEGADVVELSVIGGALLGVKEYSRDGKEADGVVITELSGVGEEVEGPAELSGVGEEVEGPAELSGVGEEVEGPAELSGVGEEVIIELSGVGDEVEVLTTELSEVGEYVIVSAAMECKLGTLHVHVLSSCTGLTGCLCLT